MNKYEQQKFREPKRRRTGVYLKCETCAREFYVHQARVRQVQSRNGHIRYCSQKCYVKTGDKNPFWGQQHSQETITALASHPNRPRFSAGPENPNFTRYAKDHQFKSRPHRASLSWRISFKQCEICGYDRHPELLQVHHKDRNRRNNREDNLIVLCPNCHHEDHFKARDGFYKRPRRGSARADV